MDHPPVPTLKNADVTKKVQTGCKISEIFAADLALTESGFLPISVRLQKTTLPISTKINILTPKAASACISGNLPTRAIRLTLGVLHESPIIQTRLYE
jgi:hypothetical protein